MKNYVSLISLISILNIGFGLYADEGQEPVKRYNTDTLLQCDKGSKKVTVCLDKTGSKDVVQCKKGGRGKHCNIETGERFKLKKGEKAPEKAGTCEQRYHCIQELEK